VGTSSALNLSEALSAAASRLVIYSKDQIAFQTAAMGNLVVTNFL